MKKTAIYTYLGTNGTITSPVYLEGIYSVTKYRLEAEGDKFLSKDNGITLSKVETVPENEVDL
jgi:trans-2-enoyl-CoA reductase